MDGLLLDAINKRCVVCAQAFGALHRVLGAYRAEELFSSVPEVEVGLFVGGCRPLFRHVACDDPTLKAWQMRPDIQYCIRCREPIQNRDVVQPVFGIQDAHAVNPFDPTDKGLTLGERIYFVHVECKNRDMSTGNGILVKA